MPDNKSSWTMWAWVAFGIALIVIGFLVAVTRRETRTESGPAGAGVPSDVEWTEQTLKEASSGDALRGLILSKRCERCHGEQGISELPGIPNLVGMGYLGMWKQLWDFKSGKRASRVMNRVAGNLTVKDIADLTAYYRMIPVPPDPDQLPKAPAQEAQAALSIGQNMVSNGDVNRGIPPCQVCHGPIGRVHGAPQLVVQKGDYILAQLDAFGQGTRTNDINMPMREIAKELKPEEKSAVADYYGSGLGLSPAGGVGRR